MLNLESMKEWAARRRIALVGLAVAGLGMGASAEVNLTEVTNIINAVIGILPDLIDLVVGVIPIIITMALVGFIVAFFDKILAMIKL